MGLVFIERNPEPYLRVHPMSNKFSIQKGCQRQNTLQSWKTCMRLSGNDLPGLLAKTELGKTLGVKLHDAKHDTLLTAIGKIVAGGSSAVKRQWLSVVHQSGFNRTDLIKKYSWKIPKSTWHRIINTNQSSPSSSTSLSPPSPVSSCPTLPPPVTYTSTPSQTIPSGPSQVDDMEIEGEVSSTPSVLPEVDMIIERDSESQSIPGGGLVELPGSEEGHLRGALDVFQPPSINSEKSHLRGALDVSQSPSINKRKGRKRVEDNYPNLLFFLDDFFKSHSIPSPCEAKHSMPHSLNRLYLLYNRCTAPPCRLSKTCFRRLWRQYFKKQYRKAKHRDGLCQLCEIGHKLNQ